LAPESIVNLFLGDFEVVLGLLDHLEHLHHLRIILDFSLCKKRNI
jgi:hypothetical protein